MKFSLRSFLFVIAFYAVIIAVAASQSLLGYMFMTLLALVVLPPFVQVGVFTTRGPKQAFFIGAAVAGLEGLLDQSPGWRKSPSWQLTLRVLLYIYDESASAFGCGAAAKHIGGISNGTCVLRSRISWNGGVVTPTCNTPAHSHR